MNFVHLSTENLILDHEQYLDEGQVAKINWISKDIYRLSPKSPSPGTMYDFSFRPLSIHPVIYNMFMNFNKWSR